MPRTLIPGADPRTALRALATQVDGDKIIADLGLSLISALGKNIKGRRTFPQQATQGIDLPSTPAALWLRGSIAALLAVLSAQVLAAVPTTSKQDEKTASDLRQKASKGDSNAALQLGNLLARGKTPAATYGNPVDWYKKGCTLGDLSACHNVGASYEYGRNGVKLDYTEAANYYLKSAERAFLPSLLNLAILHADGRVTSLDNRDGLKWMLVAQQAAAQCPDIPICKLVLEDRRGYRARLEASLSVDERREARQLAETWQPVR